jgi:prepilin-type N-terminal cleavage/methylation domain-containing protein
MMQRRGFTVVELIIVIVVLGVLAAIMIIGYGGIQRRSHDSIARYTVADAYKVLQNYYIDNKNYPSNIANTEYTPPQIVSVALWTNAPQTPVYSNLSANQNAQLFINSCASMIAGLSGFTGCTYSGNNLHASGTQSSNVVVQGPTINAPGNNTGGTPFDLGCSTGPNPAECSSAQSSIVSTFLAQGGTFPVTVIKSPSTLPAPTDVTTGAATTYCIQAQSSQYIDIVYHAIPSSPGPEPGPCPNGLGLHYP